MALRDFIKRQVAPDEDEELEQKIVDKFLEVSDKYADKGVNWHIRITADEVGLPKSLVCDYLEKHFDEEEDA